MFPELYQKVLKQHLSPSQYLMLEILVELLQRYREVSLSYLARKFPQPIKADSRRKSIKRFLQIPQLSAKLLWFPLVKYYVRQAWLKEEEKRKKKRSRKKGRLIHQGYLLLVIDRTEWKERNLMMLSLVWGTHALPVYWELLGKKGSSNWREQKRILTPVLRLLKGYPVVVLGDREFQSVKLAKWLSERKVDFALRQKKNTCIEGDEQIYLALKELGLKPGQSRFYRGRGYTKSHQLGNFNLGAYWKRKYRGKGGTEAWYILTSLPDLDLTLSCYRARWGIETLFKDCKTGGYNLETTQVNDTRFLATVLLLVLAYSLATFHGIEYQAQGVEDYLGRPTEAERLVARHSDFNLGLSGLEWLRSMGDLADLAVQLMESKPHKRLDFQRGMRAVSILQSTF